VHEDVRGKYSLLLSMKQELEEKIGTTSKNNETLRDRLATRVTEISTLTKQLDEQRNTHLLSEDAKITEITELRKDVAGGQRRKGACYQKCKDGRVELSSTQMTSTVQHNRRLQHLQPQWPSSKPRSPSLAMRRPGSTRS
jgi:hypothetical protein